MKSQFHSGVLSIAAHCLLPLAAFGTQECKVRGLTLQSGTPANEAEVFNQALTKAVGDVRIKTFLNHESDVLQFKDSTLNFSTHPDAAGAKDPDAFIGTCQIPAEAKSVILLFIPEVAGMPASKIVAIDDGAKSFPPGATMVINLTEASVKIELEDKEYIFDAHEARAITDQPVNDRNSSGMTAGIEKNGEWETFSTAVWSHPGNKRVLQLITEAPDTQQVSIRGVRDVSAPTD